MLAAWDLVINENNTAFQKKEEYFKFEYIRTNWQ